MKVFWPTGCLAKSSCHGRKTKLLNHVSKIHTIPFSFI
jgi:hypothetical protein